MGEVIGRRMQLPKEDMWFILAAYNEGKRIQNTIRSLKNNGFHNIVVVDDGSKDSTYDIAHKEKVFVIRHKINLGQGASLQTGTDFALKNKAKFIIHFDADGQHRVEDIYDVIIPILKNKYNITLGSRFLDKRKKTNMPWQRKLYLKGGLVFTKIMTGLKLTDTHNGFRAMNAKTAKEIEITQDRMEHASEILEIIARKKIKYKEVPVIIVYNDEIMANSSNSFWNGIKIIIKTIIYKLIKG